MTKDQEQIAESIVSQIISEAVWRSADGVVIEPFQDSVKTYFKKSNALRENKRIVIRNNVLPSVIECLKKKASWEIDNYSSSQSGIFETVVSNASVTISISTSISEQGEKVEMRIAYPRGMRDKMSVLKSGLSSL